MANPQNAYPRSKLAGILAYEIKAAPTNHQLVAFYYKLLYGLRNCQAADEGCKCKRRQRCFSI